MKNSPTLYEVNTTLLAGVIYSVDASCPIFLINKTDKLDLLSIYSDHKVAMLLFQQHFIDYSDTIG